MKASILISNVGQLPVLPTDQLVFLTQLSVLQLDQLLQFPNLGLVLPDFLQLGRGHRQGAPRSLHLQFLGEFLPQLGVLFLEFGDGFPEVVLGHGVVDGVVGHIAVVGLGVAAGGPGDQLAILDHKYIVGVPVRVHRVCNIYIVL